MEKYDVCFVNEVRNECSRWLHNSSVYTHEQTLQWFIEKKDPYYIYEKNGEKIGYFRTSNWDGDTCWVGMDIQRQFRGLKMAVPAYEEFFLMMDRQHGITHFKLEVLESNKRAYCLYKKLGFKELHRCDSAQGPSICMAKDYDTS